MIKLSSVHILSINLLHKEEMRIGWIHKLVKKWPGKKTFGMYRFLPMFFILGAALEFSMINWKVGEVNFYTTFKRRQAKDIIEDKIKKYTTV